MFEIPLAAAIIAATAKINQAESGYARNLVEAVSFNRSSPSSKAEAQRDANRKLCAC